jgi:hypothetical protein
MVFNATFNNISVISWQSALLMEETGLPKETHRPAASYFQTLSHYVSSSTSLDWYIDTSNTQIHDCSLPWIGTLIPLTHKHMTAHFPGLVH